MRCYVDLAVFDKIKPVIPRDIPETINNVVVIFLLKKTYHLSLFMLLKNKKMLINKITIAIMSNIIL